MLIKNALQSDGNLLSANYLIKFQPQFKPLNHGVLQSATKMGLQSLLGVGLQSVEKWVAKCARDYKVWQGELQSVAGLQSKLVHP